MPSQHELRRIRRDALRNAEDNLLQRALRSGGALGRPKGPRTAPAQEPPLPCKLPGPFGRIWNVYVGAHFPHYVGIVNEADNVAAKLAALREWPDSLSIRAILATEDPWRRRMMIRPEFLLPLVTARVQ